MQNLLESQHKIDHTSLTLNELYNAHDERENRINQIYHDIFNSCCTKIKFVNDNFFRKQTTFKVPSVLWGAPLFNVKACIAYIMVNLRQKGFRVQFYPPTFLVINWQSKPYALPSQWTDPGSSSLDFTIGNKEDTSSQLETDSKPSALEELHRKVKLIRKKHPPKRRNYC